MRTGRLQYLSSFGFEARENVITLVVAEASMQYQRYGGSPLRKKSCLTTAASGVGSSSGSIPDCVIALAISWIARSEKSDLQTRTSGYADDEMDSI